MGSGAPHEMDQRVGILPGSGNEPNRLSAEVDMASSGSENGQASERCFRRQGGSSTSEKDLPPQLCRYRRQLRTLSERWVLPPELYAKAQVQAPNESLRLCDPVSLPSWERMAQAQEIFDLSHPFGQMGMLVVNCVGEDVPSLSFDTSSTTGGSETRKGMVRRRNNTVFLALRNQEAIGQMDYSDTGLDNLVTNPVVPTLNLGIFEDLLREKNKRPLWPNATDLLAPFMSENFGLVVEAHKRQEAVAATGLF